MPGTTERSLTDLEHCVLGVVWRQGESSAYAVRAEFERSPSRDWSSSAGSIYPAIRRLCALGFLEQVGRTGPRRKKVLRTTSDGAERLRQWITTIEPPSASPTYDPIRTRLTFLTAIDIAERAAVIRDAIEKTSLNLDRVNNYLNEVRVGSLAGEVLASQGAIRELKARRSWLKSLLAGDLDGK